MQKSPASRSTSLKLRDGVSIFERTTETEKMLQRFSAAQSSSGFLNYSILELFSAGEELTLIFHERDIARAFTLLNEMK